MAAEPPDKTAHLLPSKLSYSAIITRNQSETSKINPPVSPRTAKKAFFNYYESEEQNLVADRDPEVYQNHPAVAFLKSEVSALVAKLKWQLVGKFNRMPPWKEVKNYFQCLNLSGEYTIQWYNYRHILIKLTNEFDYANVRRRPVYDFTEQHKMRVLKWDVKFSFEKESPVVPVWISFPELPNHLYEKKALMLMAKAVGVPLQMDEPTSNRSRPSRPRVCIEFDCRRPTPEKIFIHLRDDISGLNEEGFWQKMVFEKIPSYCNHCHTRLRRQRIPGRILRKKKVLLLPLTITNQGESSKVITKNSFSSLDNTSQNEQVDFGVIFCATNREASVPGSMAFEESEGVLLETGKNQRVDSDEGELKVPSQVNTRRVCTPVPENFRVLTNIEDSVIVEDVSEEEERIAPLPESDIPLEEQIGGSDKAKRAADISNQVFRMSERRKDFKGAATVDGVAQENVSEIGKVAAEAVSSGNMQEREWAAASDLNRGAVDLRGHSSMAQKSDLLGLAHMPPIHLSDTLVPNLPHFSVLKSNVPEAQGNINPEPKAKKQEGRVSSPRESCSESDVVDNWLLSERKRSLAERRVLNIEAVPFFPSSDSHRSPSWIEDGEDWGPVPLGNESTYASEGSIHSDFQQFDEDYEDDFSVHPPLRRNSTSDLVLPRKYSPPITRSRGLRISKKKNKFRLG